VRVFVSIFEGEVRQERTFLAREQKSAKQISMVNHAPEFAQSQFANDHDLPQARIGGLQARKFIPSFPR
jgi:hypothetical protein